MQSTKAGSTKKIKEMKIHFNSGWLCDKNKLLRKADYKDECIFSLVFFGGLFSYGICLCRF